MRSLTQDGAVKVEARPRRRVIITADDYGRQMLEDVRIERASSDGVLSNVSVMANLVDHRRLRHLRSSVHGCSVGVHINLTEGQPVSQPKSIATLVDNDGMFYNFRTFLFRLITNQIRYSHLTIEIAAQIAIVEELYGAPSHIDSHKHVLQFPRVLEAALQCAVSSGIRRMRTTSRIFIDSEGAANTWICKAKHYAQTPLALIARPLKTWADWRMDHTGMTRPDGLISPVPLIALGAVEENARRWERVFFGLPHGTFEINVHPGYDDRDFHLLTSPSFKEALVAAEVAIVSYSAL